MSFLDEVESANALVPAAQEARRRRDRRAAPRGRRADAGSGLDQRVRRHLGPGRGHRAELDPAIDLSSRATRTCRTTARSTTRSATRQVTSASSFGRVVTETRPDHRQAHDDVTSIPRRPVDEPPRPRTIAPDPAMTAIVNKWQHDRRPDRQPGGRPASPRTSRGPGNRAAGDGLEPNLGDMIADAQPPWRHAERRWSPDRVHEPGRPPRSVDLQPEHRGGETPGQVTYAEAFNVQPFGNFLVTMTSPARRSTACSSSSVIARPPRTQLVLGVSDGLTFDASDSLAKTFAPVDHDNSPVTPNVNCDSTRPATCSLDATTSRAVRTAIPLVLGRTYRVTVNSFLADGGDNFTVFQHGTRSLRRRASTSTRSTRYVDATRRRSRRAAEPRTERLIS